MLLEDLETASKSESTSNVHVQTNANHNNRKTQDAVQQVPLSLMHHQVLGLIYWDILGAYKPRQFRQNYSLHFLQAHWHMDHLIMDVVHGLHHKLKSKQKLKKQVSY